MSWIQRYISKKEKEIITNTFVYSHFCSKSSQNKIEKIQYRSLKLIANDDNSDYKFLLTKQENRQWKLKHCVPLLLRFLKLQTT